MSAARLPSVMKHLRAVPSPWVDAALLEALPTLTDEVASAVIELLANRGHDASLATLAGRYSTSSGELRASMLRHAAGIRAGVRSAMMSDRAADRESAIDFLCDSDDARLAYLLVDLLRNPDKSVRTRAAGGLRRMAVAVVGTPLERAERAHDVEHIGHLGEALSDAIRTWESHLEPDALTSALLLLDWTGAALSRKLAEPRQRLTGAIEQWLSAATESEHASVALRLLAVSETRAAAAAAITRAKSPAFIRGLLAESWLLVDPGIAEGFRPVREGEWLADPVSLKAPGVEVTGRSIVRCITGSGAPDDRRVDLLRRCVDSGDEDLRSEGLAALTADPSEQAYRALVLLSWRGERDVARIASREVRRRRSQVHPAPPETPCALPGSGGPPVSVWPFEAILHEYETLVLHDQKGVRNAIANAGPEGLVKFRAKLMSSDAVERLRSLRVVRDSGLATECADAMLRLSRDADATVRAVAVGLLGSIPGATTERILRTSLDDPNERVQAEAIDALEELDVKNRAALIAPRLASRAARARAGAVRALLTSELADAGGALLNMLGDDDADHRVGALWVVEHLALRAVARRVERLAMSDPDPRVRRRARRVVEGWGEVLPPETSDIGATRSSGPHVTPSITPIRTGKGSR